MLTLRSRLFSFALLSGALLSGCSGTPTEDASADTTVAGEETAALATLELGPGHRVLFFDSGQGLSLAEVVPANASPALRVTDDIQDRTFAGVYRYLAPAGSVVPQALIDADARFAALPQEAAPTASPPAIDGPSSGTGPALYNDEQHNWFVNNYCSTTYNVLCFKGWDWITAGYYLGSTFRPTAYVHSGATSPAKFTAFRWNPSTGQDDQIASHIIGDNEVWVFTMWWNPASYWRVALADPGCGTMASLAIDINRPIKGGPPHI